MASLFKSLERDFSFPNLRSFAGKMFSSILIASLACGVFYGITHSRIIMIGVITILAISGISTILGVQIRKFLNTYDQENHLSSWGIVFSVGSAVLLALIFLGALISFGFWLTRLLIEKLQ